MSSAIATFPNPPETRGRSSAVSLASQQPTLGTRVVDLRELEEALALPVAPASAKARKVDSNVNLLAVQVVYSLSQKKSARFVFRLVGRRK